MDNGQESAIAEIEGKGLSIEALCAKLDDFENKVPISSGYFSPDVGVVNRCYFLKHDRINPSEGNDVDSEDGLVPAVRLLMKDGTVQVSAASGLVQLISEASLPAMTPIEVVLAEKEKRGAKTFFKWDVSRLQ